MEAKGIGQRIRIHRQRKGLTQTELADRIGVSYQQIQKYESDRSQITLQRLFLIARALEIPIQDFVAEQHAQGLADSYAPRPHAKTAATLREERALLRLFTGIRNPMVRRAILNLLKRIVEQQNTPSS